MANITITIPQNKIQLVIDVYADTYNYQLTVDDGNGGYLEIYTVNDTSQFGIYECVI